MKASQSHDIAKHDPALPRVVLTRIGDVTLLWSGRIGAFVAFVVLGLLFTASGAKAGCATLPYKASAAPFIPFVSPQGDDHQGGRFERGRFHSGSVAPDVHWKDGYQLPPRRAFPTIPISVPRIL